MSEPNREQRWAAVIIALGTKDRSGYRAGLSVNSLLFLSIDQSATYTAGDSLPSISCPPSGGLVIFLSRQAESAYFDDLDPMLLELEKLAKKSPAEREAEKRLADAEREFNRAKAKLAKLKGEPLQ